MHNQPRRSVTVFARIELQCFFEELEGIFFPRWGCKPSFDTSAKLPRMTTPSPRSLKIWAVSGPLHFSDTWQLVINIGTTIVTFLMVFLIQNTENRDAKAINLQLNELIYATAAAGDQMLDIEKLSDEELNIMQSRYEQNRAECIRREGAMPKRGVEHTS